MSAIDSGSYTVCTTVNSQKDCSKYTWTLNSISAPSSGQVTVTLGWNEGTVSGYGEYTGADIVVSVNGTQKANNSWSGMQNIPTNPSFTVNASVGDSITVTVTANGFPKFTTLNGTVQSATVSKSKVSVTSCTTSSGSTDTLKSGDSIQYIANVWNNNSVKVDADVVFTLGGTNIGGFMVYGIPPNSYNHASSQSHTYSEIQSKAGSGQMSFDAHVAFVSKS